MAVALAEFYGFGAIFTATALAAVWATEPQSMTATQWLSAALAWPVTWWVVVAVILDDERGGRVMGWYFAAGFLVGAVASVIFVQAVING